MADAKTAALTENLAPASTVVLPAQSADGLTDYRIPYSVFTAAITAAVAALINSAPGALDTLDELAAAFGDDANFATTVTNALATKQAADADLTAIAALSSAADKFPYATGAQAWTLGDITSAARTFLAAPTAANVPITDAAGDFDAANVETALAELQTFDETLTTAEAGVRTAPDTSNPGFISFDVDLATGISGGDTLTGGTGASEILTLRANTTGSYGTINLQDQVLLMSADRTFSASTDWVVLMDTPSTRTFTFSSATGAGRAYQLLRFAPTMVFTATAPTFYGFMINAGPTIKNDTGNARTLGTNFSVVVGPTIQADAATVTAAGNTGIWAAPTFNVVSAGVLNLTASDGFLSGATVGAGATVTTLRHFALTDVGNSGTVTTQVGVDIPSLVGGTTNIGFRNAGTTVHTRQTPTISAASTQIVPTATLITLNTSTSYTLTATPTIAAGQAGQHIIIIGRHATGVQTFQDSATLVSSGLRLGAPTRAVGPGDTLVLNYETGLAAWVEESFVASVS